VIENQRAHKLRPIQTKKPQGRLPHGSFRFSFWLEDQSAALAATDFSDDLLREDGLDSVADDFDSVAGFDSLAGFDVESLDDAVAPLVADFSVVELESESVLLGVLFLA
jgi:hypothetical protein